MVLLILQGMSSSWVKYLRQAVACLWLDIAELGSNRLATRREVTECFWIFCRG